jgi:endonuclease/exonuclease/phosphatase family metal-dependent hydrolase
MRALLLCLVFCLPHPGAARAWDLKVATWNLNWLTTRAAGLPSDVTVRAPEDFQRLAAYAARLNADIVALQEVDTVETARLLFPRDAWSIHLSRDHVRQRTGFAVRRGIEYDINPDVTAIALEPEAHLRSGVDIVARLPSGPLRLLAVHLKTGCHYAALGRDPRASCATLLSQFDAVAAWMAARTAEGTGFLVLGDFNRMLEAPDPFSARIGSAMRATAGFTSPCWGQEGFIDHILAGGPARDWLVPRSLRVLAYQETEPAWKARLSDHCPVSVRLSGAGDLVLTGPVP